MDKELKTQKKTLKKAFIKKPAENHTDSGSF